MRLDIAAVLAGIAVATHPAGAQCGPPSLDRTAANDGLVVSTAWLTAHQRDRNLVVLHVGNREEFEAGHISGARFASATAFLGDSMDLLPADSLQAILERLGVTNDSRVILYGDHWHLGFAVVALDLLGHADHWAVLDGGLPQWRLERRPLERGAPPPISRTRYAPRETPGVMVDANWLRPRLGDDRIVIIDVRTPAEYAGTGEHGAHGGHIPGARLLEWTKSFARANAAEAEARQSLLADVGRLRGLFEAAGVRPGRQVVLYCTVGMRASWMYFVARRLGYTAKFYDGSWVDWTSRGLPTVTGPAPGGTQ